MSRSRSTTPSRRSRRRAGEEPEFQPGSEILIPTNAIVARSADQPESGEDQQKKDEGSKARKKNNAPHSSTPASSSTEAKEEAEVENVDEQSSAGAEEEEAKAESKTAQPAEEERKTLSDDDYSESVEGQGEYNPFRTATSSSDPVTHEQFEFFVAKIGDLVEARLKVFANEMKRDKHEKKIPEVSKPKFVDPVKPSSVENLPERKTRFHFEEDVPLSKVERAQKRDKENGGFSNDGKARPEFGMKSSFKLSKEDEWMNSPEYFEAMKKWNERSSGVPMQSGSKPEVVCLSDEGFNFSYLNPWEKPGLNIVSDSTIAKLAQNERVYKIYDDQGELRAKYNCKSDGFEKFRMILKEKIDRMAMRGTMTVVTSEGNHCSLIDRGQLITHQEILDHRDETWLKDSYSSQGECDKYNDARLKSHILGEWLLDSLTDSAKMKVMATQKEWMLKPEGDIHMQSIGSRYHGPLIYWHIVRIVKPNNDTLIEKAKKDLKSLNCKRFNDDVVSMLIQFELKIDEIITTLGGSMTEDEMVNTMWDAVLTSKDHEFKRRINDMRRSYRKTPIGQRDSVDVLIQEIKEEQINMAADGIFNQPDKSRDHTLALTSIVEKLVDQVNSRPNPSNGNGNGDRGRRQIPDWKYKRDGNETTKTVNNITYYWCKYHKGPNGEKEHGMWCAHKEADHKFGKRSNESRGSGSDNSNGNGSKGDSSKSSSNDGGEGSITVDRKLFSAIRNNSNITSFLGKLKDDTSSVKGRA